MVQLVMLLALSQGVNLSIQDATPIQTKKHYTTTIYRKAVKLLVAIAQAPAMICQATRS
jgi:hypothetical protein